MSSITVGLFFWFAWNTTRKISGRFLDSPMKFVTTTAPEHYFDDSEDILIAVLNTFQAHTVVQTLASILGEKRIARDSLGRKVLLKRFFGRNYFIRLLG